PVSRLILRFCTPYTLSFIPHLSLHDSLPILIIGKIGKKPLDRPRFEVLVRHRKHVGRIDIKSRALYVLAVIAVDIYAVLDALSLDRKSTRLNSSHVSISYAVLCFKKKTLITS